MDANWPVCLKAILEQEGGNDDDVDDPGGRTSRGITQREYNAYRHLHGLEGLKDVWAASDQEVADIYHTSYWLPYCPQMPSGVDLVYFDEAVNAGPHEATLLLQRALNVNADGHIGIVTMAALKQANPVFIIKKFSDLRRAYYRSLRLFRKYGRGWLNRTAAIEQQSDRIA
jgi:lysozyme family protein